MKPIVIESIKNSELRAIANKCDKNQNGKVEEGIEFNEFKEAGSLWNKQQHNTNLGNMYSTAQMTEYDKIMANLEKENMKPLPLAPKNPPKVDSLFELL